MALEQPRSVFGKVSIVFATKLKSFSLLPILKKLPAENRVKSVSSNLSKALGDNGAAAGKTANEGIHKAEVVYISDMEFQDITKHSEPQKYNTKPAVSPLPAPDVAHAEIGCTSPKPYSDPLDTAANKPPKIPQLECHNTESELRSGQFLNTEAQREDEVLSPVSSVDLFTSPFSSKESILPEGWEHETSWSAVQMLSPSGSISPCSSVRSGTFTSSVMRIKCHKLAPGSSLMQMPLTSCQTLGCKKHITSSCPLSTRARHRPPPTQLSLLTAILRKGRLPILSPSLQRPYSPCWPISPVNISSCTACSAASAVTPMVNLPAKSCVSKSMTCTEPSCKLQPKPPGLITKTGSVPPKDQNTQNLSSTAIDTPDATRSNVHVSRSDIKSPHKRCSLTLLNPSKLSPEHLYKQPHKEIHVSTDRSFLLDSSSIDHFSAESKFDSQIEGNRHKSNETPSPIVRNIKPHQTSPADFKPALISHEQSLTPDQNRIQQAQEVMTSAIPEYTDIKPGFYSRNDRKIFYKTEKIHAPAFQHSPSPRAAGFTHLTITPSVSPVSSSPRAAGFTHLTITPSVSPVSPSPRAAGFTHLTITPSVSPVPPSPRPGSCISTSEGYTLSQSPAISYHHRSPSPSYSLRSSPVSSLRESSPDCTDRGSKKPHKIKSTYKAFAAIPTNTLLLEQQAIDDEVNKNNTSLDPSDSFAWEDPHSQMCSPAQLRQQSKELYEVIDEVLKDTVRTSPSNPANQLAVPSETTRKPTPSPPPPRSLGRETKYAHFHHQSPTPAEKTLTKPGVITAVMVNPKLQDDRERRCFSNSYQRQKDSSRFSSDHQSQFVSRTFVTKDEPHGRGDLEMDQDFSEEPVKCTPSPALVFKSRERSTPSPRRAPL
ncbi:muscular LMNA-interacting protein isoform X2 [Silurus meridionalis]|uniref:muscular LMNA-interacting protein isoform X2 n=1 Tax=Silurus meridionalis TaxID=175797 RepID=UPI001EEAF0E5|nr:muscular LMNA-interacting protein isoform X2 [Silurus meridionalis]